MKISTIEIPIYFGDLRIIFTTDFVATAKELNIDDEGNDLTSMGAFVSSWTSGIGLTTYNVMMDPDIDHDLIAHEVVHIVNSIYVERRMKLDPHNDEPQAYLTGWVTKQIYNALASVK